MEVLKELHASVAEACEVSFDNAYRHLNSSLARSDERVREAEHNALMASQAQKAAEDRIRALQYEVSVLQTELKRYEVDPKGLELPQKFANLEDEFSRNMFGRAIWTMLIPKPTGHPKGSRPSTQHYMTT